MNPDDVFAQVADQRRAVADLVEELDEQQLATPSLCVGWDVLTVAAHLTVIFTVTPWRFGAALVRSGGSFHRANHAMAVSAAAAGPAAVAAMLRRKATSRATPPIGGPRAPLTDLLVHRADMLLPLGRAYDPPGHAVAQALDFLTESGRGFVPRERITGIRFEATDLGRSWGEGKVASGRAIDLVLASCGREPAFAGLSGEGAELLQSRFTSSPRPPD